MGARGARVPSNFRRGGGGSAPPKMCDLFAVHHDWQLNNCLMLHVHKRKTDECDLVEIAREFVMLNDEFRKYFGSFS